MKQRLLVMNGQRVIQTEQQGEWRVGQVDKAVGMLKPGIYNLYQARSADTSQAHVGVILHADQAHVYQQVGRACVQHDRAKFDKVPPVGSVQSIAYANGRAVAEPATVTVGRRMGR